MARSPQPTFIPGPQQAAIFGTGQTSYIPPRSRTVIGDLFFPILQTEWTGPENNEPFTVLMPGQGPTLAQQRVQQNGFYKTVDLGLKAPS